MADAPESGLASRMARLNVFRSKSKRGVDDEDQGQAIDSETVGGGGHSAFPTGVTQHHLRVSDALKTFLEHEGVVSEGNPESLAALLDKPVVVPPSHLLDRSHPLPEYFISSSHNTYLMAHQLYGTSSAGAYETTLKAGARCIEIDAWDNPANKEEPKVTHGFTLVSNIPFRVVCETIKNVVDQEASAPAIQGYAPAPILVSLENHCEPDGQRRLVEIMKEVWGDRLLSAPVRKKGHQEQEGGELVRLVELGSKIALIVEFHLPDEEDSSSNSSSSSSSESEDERKTRAEYKAKKKAKPPPIIVPELAELGIYAQSVKPRDASWYIDGKINDGPVNHHLVNMSESGLAAHMTEHAAEIARHNTRHLVRTFDASMQLNDALFAGTAGYVLKPAALRSGGSGELVSTARRKILRLRVAGATGVPLHEGRDVEDLKPYLTCTLLHPAGRGAELIKTKRKTAVYHRRRIMQLPVLRRLSREAQSPVQTDPVWDETLEWEFDDNELVFVRMFIKSDDSFSSNPILAVAPVRLLYVQPGWRFVRMLDLRGHETTCSLLVKFDIHEA
ncbi:hypothetical protein N0V88_008071 [Collariella sp. IMI 366227]|nr:hypothetical protein N0V88_008071 [Collariella sp. IMI 366227]